VRVADILSLPWVDEKGSVGKDIDVEDVVPVAVSKEDVVNVIRRDAFLGQLLKQKLTTAHLRGPYNMAYDMFPYDTMQRKLALLEQAAREGWVLLYDHDPVVRYSRVREDGEGRYAPLSYT